MEHINFTQHKMKHVKEIHIAQNKTFKIYTALNEANVKLKVLNKMQLKTIQH